MKKINVCFFLNSVNELNELNIPATEYWQNTAQQQLRQLNKDIWMINHVINQSNLTLRRKKLKLKFKLKSLFPFSLISISTRLENCNLLLIIIWGNKLITEIYLHLLYIDFQRYRIKTMIPFPIYYWPMLVSGNLCQTNPYSDYI